MMPLKTIFVALSIFLSLAAGAAGQEDKPSLEPQPDSLRIGQQAPGVYLQTLEEEDFFLSNHCGEKLRRPWENQDKHVVVLSFWATWCKPCLSEIGFLTELEEECGKDGLRIFLVDVGESLKKVRKFVKSHDIQLPVLLDRYGVIWKRYGGASVPRMVVICRDGTISYIGRGWRGTEEGKAAVRSQIVRALEK